MNKVAAAVAGVLLAFGWAGQAATTKAEDGEAKLAAMLEGRVAGEPRSCIPGLADRRLQVIDETAVVYDAGETIYVARPINPPSIEDSDVLIVERSGGQLCKQDIVRTVDRFSGFMTGVVFLGDFVPYTKR